jgi:hypothetical protein
MERMWGPPQRSVEEISPRVAAAAEHTVPMVWFLDSGQISAEQVATAHGGRDPGSS